MSSIKDRVKSNPRLKELVLNLMVHPVKTRPRVWLRLFMRFYTSRGKGSVIYRSVRKDLVPFNRFIIGDRSVIEDFSIVNNMVGDVVIGRESRAGLGNVIIGPVSIGNNVIIAQGVVLSGLDHNYKECNITISKQGVSTSLINIEDDVWIGANAVITKGVTIGKHSIIAACSLVNKDVPPFSIVAGNPAKVIKQYNHSSGEWERNNSSTQ
ncbi:MAG TPA: acetyltransferase [Rikenellaceae bacterium]|nr:acetyltransferase [Rikenellaceae bacterium]